MGSLRRVAEFLGDNVEAVTGAVKDEALSVAYWHVALGKIGTARTLPKPTKILADEIAANIEESNYYSRHAEVVMKKVTTKFVPGLLGAIIDP